jgi:hypothetical protein
MDAVIALAITVTPTLAQSPNRTWCSFSLTMSATIGLEHMVDVLDFGGRA